MKYIRTKHGRIIDLSDYAYSKTHHWFAQKRNIKELAAPHHFCWKEEYNDVPDCMGKIFVEQLDKNECKEADTIEELCDEYIVVNASTGQWHRTFHWFDAKELKFWFGKEMPALVKEGKFDVYAAIMANGEHDEPVLKSVAKMKGVLQNGEIDWVLL